MARIDIAAGIWVVEGEPVSFFGFPYPTRSVVIRLADGGLWVWSPVQLTPALKAEIDGLGPPAHLVSPNKIHHLFLAEWSAAYPDAALWGPASTIKKRSDLTFGPPLEDTPPPAWGPEFDQVWFNGSVAMDEIVFFHRPSSTAILADLSENFSDAFLNAHWSRWMQWVAHKWKITERAGGFAPLEWRLSFLNRKVTRIARDRVLAWDPVHVVMAHGEWQRRNGRAFLARALSWVD